MKISLWVPQKETLQNIIDFVDSEIAEAKNIKSKKNMKKTTSALQSIRLYLIANKTGKCYFAEDDKSIDIIEYEGNIKRYHCGRDFIKPEPIKDYS